MPGSEGYTGGVMHYWWVLLLAFALSLFVTACDGDSSDSANVGAETTATTHATEEVATGPRVRIVLAPAEDTVVGDLDAALEEVLRIIERRSEELGLANVKAEREGEKRIVVEASGLTVDEAVEKLARTGLLQFCEPVVDEAGNVLVARQGTVQYQPQTCEPVRGENGNVVVEGGTAAFEPLPTEPAGFEFIVWEPAAADLDGDGTREAELTGEFLESNTFVDASVSAVNPLGEPFLVFSLSDEGGDVMEQITERLSQRRYPLAPFLDGEPFRGEDGSIIAPFVQSAITSQGTITGLSQEDAEDLTMLLNTGAFPIPMEILEIKEIE